MTTSTSSIPTGPARQMSSKWTGVKVGHQTFKGLVTQTGFNKEQLQRVLNGLDP